MITIQYCKSKFVFISALCGLVLLALFRGQEYGYQHFQPADDQDNTSLPFRYANTMVRRDLMMNKNPTHPQLCDNNDKMEKRIKELEYINSMLLARSRAAITGPIPLSSLTESQQNSFNSWNMGLNTAHTVDGTGGKSNVDQAPSQVSQHSLMARTEDGLGWEKKWSKKLVDHLINAVRKNEDISPRTYPGSALQVQQAFEDHVINNHFSKKNPRIMVGGSISPWIESIVLAVTGVPKVWVADYQPIEMIGEDRIECIQMETLQKKKPDELFDIIVSFSSIEHDGLGRYGDPINPDGDFAAVAEFWTLLNPGGLLMLAVPHLEHPAIKNGFVMGNLHRQYSRERLQAISKGFQVIETIEAGTEKLAERFHKPFETVEIWEKGLSWQNQPIVIMKKITEEVPLILEEVFST